MCAEVIFVDFHQIFTYFIGMILVGTSGFQYRDWVPVFYPRNLDPGSWLSYYSQRFGCCELGFTSYRIPEVLQFKKLSEETRGALPFIFRAPSRLSEEHPDNPDLARRFAAALMAFEGYRASWPGSWRSFLRSSSLFGTTSNGCACFEIPWKASR